MSRLGVGSTVQKFVIEKFLGKGSYGAVYKVKRKDDGKDYAMKQINTQKMVSARAAGSPARGDGGEMGGGGVATGRWRQLGCNGCGARPPPAARGATGLQQSAPDPPLTRRRAVPAVPKRTRGRGQ